MTYQYYRGKPLFPFGYGLSYTSFRYGQIRVDRPLVTSDGKVRVSVDVTNTGDRAGSDVVQLYSSARDSRAQQPLKQLRAFQKVSLGPRQTKTVTLTVAASDLAFWDVTRSRAVVETGLYDFSVGRSAQDIKQSTPVFVWGERIPARDLANPVQAQNFDDYHATTLTDTSKASGTSVGAAAGGWLAFKNVQLAPSATRFTASVAKPDAGTARITVRLDDPVSGRVLGVATATSTGDRYSYTTINAELAKAAGRHDVYLTFDGPVILSTFQLTR
jgi:beta-glucosidase